MRTKGKHQRRSDVSAVQQPGRARAATLSDWADGEDMLEGLGGVDPDYDRADDAVPQMLRGSWRAPRFEGE